MEIIEIVNENAYYQNYFNSKNHNSNNKNFDENSEGKNKENLFHSWIGNEAYTNENKKERLVKFHGYYILEQQDSDNNSQDASSYKKKLRSTRSKKNKMENGAYKIFFSEIGFHVSNVNAIY